MDSGHRETHGAGMSSHLWELDREETGDIDRDLRRFGHKAAGRYIATLFIKREIKLGVWVFLNGEYINKIILSCHRCNRNAN